ncbi:MAG: hypothetical protein EXR70_24850 [Deltaproteobacteria bacterium]|nr:hypothetical protein [Deltaproteobacteria bacterium]
MQEIVLEVVIFVIDNPLYAMVMALLTGFLATRWIAAERRPGPIVWGIIGVIGFLLGRLALTYLDYNETLDGLRELRYVIDLVVSCVGAFAIASLIHMIKPS